MAGVALVSPKIPFFDSLGVPLVGGTLDVYLAGTTTRTNTYQDKAQTTLNTNPIVLDSRGECTLWADDTLTYRFVLKNSAGVQQWDVDNISGLNVSGTLVTFTQAGTGATSRTAQDKMREVFSVKDFGATGDGTTDDVTAIRLCIAAALAAAQSGTADSGVPLTSCPTVRYPKGKYRVSAYMTADTDQAVNFIAFEGDDSVIVPDAGVVAFGGVGPHVVFRRLQVLGGATAISVKTANSDGSLILLDHCVLSDQTTSSIKVDATSNSTSLIVRGGELATKDSNPGAKLIDALSGDKIIVDGTWCNARNDSGAAFDITNATLTLKSMLGVPRNVLRSWVDLRGSSSLLADSGTRFGGEFSGATTIVRCYVSAVTAAPIAPNALRIKNCHVYCQGAPVEFYAIPNIVDIQDNEGLIDVDAFSVDAATPAADLNAIGALHSEFTIRRNISNSPIGNYLGYTTGGAQALLGLPLLDERMKPVLSAPLGTADVLLNLAGFSGAYSYVGSAPLTTPSTRLSGGGTASRFLATANGQDIAFLFATALSGLAAGIKTAKIVISVDTETVFALILTVCRSQKIFYLPRGDHVVNLPFYYDGATNGITINGTLPNAGQVTVHRFGILRGARKEYDHRMKVVDTAVPAAGSWLAGDEWENSAPAAATSPGSICVTGGAPGTWKARAALAA